MLDDSDKKWIDKIIKEKKKMKNEGREYKYTLSYYNGQPNITIRTDNSKELDLALNKVLPIFGKLKTAIDNGKKKTQSEPNSPKSGLQMTCEVHNIKMAEAISKKTGNPYWYHRDSSGTMCFGKGWQPR